MRKRCKGEPDPELYALKVAQLAELELLLQHSMIDLFYGDESRICSKGCVPYGWQFPDENIYIPVEKGYKINVWAIITRKNKIHSTITEQNIDADFVFNQLETISLKIQKPTVIALDNASIHKAKIIQNQLQFWQKRVGPPMRIIYFLSASLLSSIKYR
jgi:hypothetical protein